MLTTKEKQTLQQGLQLIEHFAHTISKSKGFYDTPPTEPERFCLMHSEISEALEGYRHGNPPSDHIPDFTAIEEKMADIIIRVCDYSEYRGLRLAEAVIAKMQYNSTRPYKHGKKL